MRSRSSFASGPIVVPLWAVAACSSRPAVQPADTPRGTEGWRPDATAIAVKDGRIVFVGSVPDAAVYQGPSTRVADLKGATALPGMVDSHVPEQARAWVLAGLKRIARDGYVAVHEAGADRELMQTFEALRASNELPTRVYAILSARDAELSREWQRKAPLLGDTGA